MTDELADEAREVAFDRITLLFGFLLGVLCGIGVMLVVGWLW